MAMLTSIPCAAKQMNGSEKASLALEAMKKSKPVAALSKAFNVSRQFIHRQKAKAVEAVNKEFSDSMEQPDDEKVLFNIPVTKSWLKQVALSLLLDCQSSFRGAKKMFANVLDYSISVSTLFSYYLEAVTPAQQINHSEKLGGIDTGAQDEMFINNAPVLTGIDVNSLYCYLASMESQRDGDTWAIKLMELQDNEFNPTRVIADDGSGLRAGHQMVFPEVPCDGDVFHMVSTLISMRLFFRNRLKSSMTDRLDLEEQIKRAEAKGKTPKNKHRLSGVIEHEQAMASLSSSIDTLVHWIQHDIFQKAGADLNERRNLYDFIVAELIKLEEVHPHRIKEVRIALQNQRDQLLSFVSILTQQFSAISKKHQVPINTLWKVCELLRCDLGSDNYAVRSLSLYSDLGEKLDIIEDEVIEVLINTERTSCMVENLHSRIRPYADAQKGLNQRFIDLLRFYLNHTPFLRSTKDHRKNKSPAEILFQHPHPHWLEMLGFVRFKRA